jgi:hypothetical protein
MQGSSANFDLIARGIEYSVWLALGTAGLFYYRRRMRLAKKAGLLVDVHAKARLQQLRMLSYFLIALGVVRAFLILR